MKINLLLTGGLFDSQAGYSAWQFCKAALEAGHTIQQVFFYQHAVSHGTRLAVPSAGEFDAPGQWVQLSRQASFPLVVCVSAAERRGLVSEDQDQQGDATASNLHSAFTVAGLGALHEASLSSDRTVTFK